MTSNHREDTVRLALSFQELPQSVRSKKGYRLCAVFDLFRGPVTVLKLPQSFSPLPLPVRHIPLRVQPILNELIRPAAKSGT